MNQTIIAFLIGIGLSIITVVADSLIKHSTLKHISSSWPLLVIGSIIYGLTALGWFFVMKKIKLSTIGVLYGVSCAIFLTLIGVFYFKEKINTIEIIAIILAITSLILLARFS